MFGIYLFKVIDAGHMTVQTNKKAQDNQFLLCALKVFIHIVFWIFADKLRLSGVNSEEVGYFLLEATPMLL